MIPSATTPTLTDNTSDTPRYIEPDWFTGNVFNPVVARCTKWGLSLWGSRVLEVPGRNSGATRSTPVNVLTIGEHRYLVAPRGVTQWVRNVRAAGSCDLRVGRRVEHVDLIELDDADKPEVLRAYLGRWKWEVGQFFDGVGPDASDVELIEAGQRHPVFEIHA